MSKEELGEIIKAPEFQSIIQSTDFYFQKGQDALKKWLDLDVAEDVKEKIIVLSKDYEKLQVIAKEDSKINDVLKLLFEITSYCDNKAKDKFIYNEYHDKRAIGAAFVRMNYWIDHLVLFKFSPHNLKDGSTKNAFQYLLKPVENLTILSENHRKLIAENFIKITYEPQKFVENLKKYFGEFDLKTNNEQNYTHLLSRIIYSIFGDWNEEVVALMASDGTGWHQEHIAEWEDHDAGILWNSKRPSGTIETLKFLKNANDDGRPFNLYYCSGGYVNFKATIIDFAESQGDLDKKEWEKKKNKIMYYHKNFSEYTDNNKKASIVFLAENLQQIIPIPVSAFKFYKDYSAPRQDNISPIKFEPETDVNISMDSKKNHVENINNSFNQILFGPPGTGKTYNSIDKAVEIASINKYVANDHSANKKVFDDLKRNGQIEFVTFHQNYSYEDFVLGIRPNVDEETNGLSFKKHYGIFYQIADRAKENYLSSLEEKGKLISVQELTNDLVERLRSGEVINLKTPTNIPFSIEFLSDQSIQLVYNGGSRNNTLSVATLIDITEEKRDYTTSLRSYYYPLKEYLLSKRLDAKKEKEELKNFILIIDEINRANISKVFGELITLLEDDKRLGKENELKVTLPNGEKEFGVPPNLYIIGTMNTADKSIALIDIALRRRFEFIGYYPKYETLENIEEATLLKKINDAIFREKKSADYLIGHAYFMKKQKIETVLRNKVVPLLMEYFSGKTDIVSKIFTDTNWNVTYNTSSFNWDISPK